MTLSEYIKAARGNATTLAAKIGASKTQISNWAKGNSPPIPATCVAIVRATGGLVTLQELRPDDWQKIWPNDAKWDGITERRFGPPDRRGSGAKAAPKNGVSNGKKNNGKKGGK